MRAERFQVEGAQASRAPWAEGMWFSLPAAVIDRLGWRRHIENGALRLASAPPVDPRAAADVREQAAFTDRPPATSRLPVSYQFVPGPLRAIAASMIGRRHRRRSHIWAAFPGWPIDLAADLLSDLAGVPAIALGGRTPVLLTHDIDSPEGLRRLVGDFLPLEEKIGARSANYVVPCAWTPDDRLLEEVRARGHEIGVHGYDHSNRTPFADEGERTRRLDAPRGFAERFGAVGYRAPSLLRTRALLRGVAERYRYDSSIPTSGGLFPSPNNGCASARPFWIEGVLELPLSLPRDGSLRFLGYSPDEILRTWIDCADAIARSGGLVVLLTHCEARFSGNRAMLEAYAQFLNHLHAESARFAFTTPRDVASRLRDAQPV